MSLRPSCSAARPRPRALTRPRRSPLCARSSRGLASATMRIYLTGASGFVGSNLAYVFERHGAEVIGPSHAEVDLADADATLRSVRAAAPGAIVHAAIWNAFAGLLSDRRKA